MIKSPEYECYKSVVFIMITYIYNFFTLFNHSEMGFVLFRWWIVVITLEYDKSCTTASSDTLSGLAAFLFQFLMIGAQTKCLFSYHWQTWVVDMQTQCTLYLDKTIHCVYLISSPSRWVACFPDFFFVVHVTPDCIHFYRLREKRFIFLKSSCCKFLLLEY